jgi:hypothetical protein
MCRGCPGGGETARACPPPGATAMGSHSNTRRRSGPTPGGPEARLVCTLPRPLPDGRSALLLTPLELLQRLARLIPPLRAHRHRNHGALAPHARGRSAVDGPLPRPPAVSFRPVPDPFRHYAPEAREPSRRSPAPSFAEAPTRSRSPLTPSPNRPTPTPPPTRTPSGGLNFLFHFIRDGERPDPHPIDLIPS